FQFHTGTIKRYNQSPNITEIFYNRIRKKHPDIGDGKLFHIIQKKMKRVLLFVLSTLFFIPLFDGCRKGGGDPLIFLRSRTKRLTGEWSCYVYSFNFNIIPETSANAPTRNTI
ncbi:MAG: hypothetical protein KJ607_04580, partial [Bacteroidetes bacterium]|nr:hypothetical protein [Bacteroidota bacterium]